MGTNNYDDSSIDALVGAERLRERPASMLGSSGLDGARHGFIELYGNALDEKDSGFGDRLDVIHHEDGSISLRDYGRGVPMGWNSNPKVNNWNWHTIYNDLYAGGKLDNNQALLRQVKDWSTFNPRSINYLFSVGLNGVGASATQYTSEFFSVRSYRDGKVKCRDFKRGYPLVNGEPFNMFTATPEEIKAIPEIIEDTDEPNGTFIHWKPDDKVFSDINIGADWLLDTCKDIAGVAGIDLHFEDRMTGRVIDIPAGDLTSVLESRAGNVLLRDGDSPIVFTGSTLEHGHITINNEDTIWVCECEFAIGLTKAEVPYNCFHNSVKMSSNEGVHCNAIQDALTEFLSDIALASGVRLSRNDYEGVFGVALSTRSNCSSFRGQTKDHIDDMYVYTVIKPLLKEKLQLEYGKGNQYIKDAVNRVIETARNRIEASELQALARKVNTVKRGKAPAKFESCEAYESKNYEEVELWICEGDSACGSIVSARNSKFQAAYPIRGKGLNVAKASIKKILANKEIKELFNIIGTGFDLDINGEKFFNIDDLRVGKIIIATDADEDGYQIRVLIFLTFYILAPQLIRDGRLYIAETPRFGIDMKDGRKIYAIDDAERDKIIAMYPGQVRNIARYKGLGEVNAEILHETTINPDTRKLIPVTCDMLNQTERDIIDALFGADKYKQRKEILSSVLGADVSDLLDDNALLLGDIDDSEVEEDIDLEVVTV